MPSLTHSTSKARTKKASSKTKSKHSHSQSSSPPNHTNQSNHNHTNGHMPSHKSKAKANGKSKTDNTNGNGQSLTDNREFLHNRSPFYETISRHIVMPICQKQLINFQFNLPTDYVTDIKNGCHSQKSKKKKRISNHDNTTMKRLLHIRLFDLGNNKHVQWQPYHERNSNGNEDGFKLKINGKSIKMPPIKTDKKAKKKDKSKKAKGFRFVQPLDISKYGSNAMSFEISCHKQIFYGAASIEIVNLLSVDQIAARVISRSELASSLHEINDSKSTDLSHRCKICGKTDNLSRCSRCKATWYCCRDHQQMDWNSHHLGCQSFDALNKLKLLNNKPNTNHNDNDIICNEIKVSIRDPLSLCRISVAVRGTHCYHPQCVDLQTYLGYCHNTKTWQCPICCNALTFEDLCVDKSMNKIIKEISDDIEQVRLNPDDYTYKVITLAEQQACDGHMLDGDGSREDSASDNRKRRLQNGEGVSEPLNKKRKMNIEIIVLD